MRCLLTRMKSASLENFSREGTTIFAKLLLKNEKYFNCVDTGGFLTESFTRSHYEATNTYTGEAKNECFYGMKISLEPSSIWLLVGDGHTFHDNTLIRV